MALDQKIYELRKDKLKQIEALGQSAYPYRYETTHSIPQILDEYTAKTAPELESPKINVSVAGRLMSIRVQGKAGFAHLQQGGKRLQIYVRLDFVGEKGFQLYKLLDIGDYIGVKGYLFRTTDQRADDPRRRDHISGQGSASLAGEVARSAGCRNALPPPLRRSHHES